MADFMLLMHGDAVRDTDPAAWDAYFAALSQSGCFDGGSSIGVGETFRRDGDAAPVSAHLEGFIRVRAADAADARRWIDSNPVYLAGGTVELRELPED